MLAEILGALLLFAVAALFAGMGLALLYRAATLCRRGIRVAGRVAGYSEATARGGAFPIVEFLDNAGTNRRSRLCSWTGQKPALGTSVTLLYLADRPDEAFGTSLVTSWLIPIACTLLGAGGMYIAVNTLATTVPGLWHGG